MKKLALMVFAVLCTVSIALSQRTITGNVVDTEGLPLIGANVFVENSEIGSITDIDGNFEIEGVPNDALNLIVSYTGYNEQSVNIEGLESISVTLTEGALLDELVISGQGAGINKKRLSTSVDALTSEDIEKLPNDQIDQILQSTTPSAQIRLSSGQPGTASIIRTRGPISANGSSTPIIIVDGVRVDNLNSNPSLGLDTGGADISSLADIPVESIEKVEYIKGGAATTLYGADAANGVIQIITKKGRGGAGSFFVETSLGFIKGTTDFLHYDRTAEAIFETGVQEELKIGFNGGTEKFNYNFAGSLYGDDSFNDYNAQTRRSFSFGFGAQINDKLSYQGSISNVNFNFNTDFNANTSFSRFSNFEGGARGNLDELTDEEWQPELERSQNLGNLVDITGNSNRITASNKLTYDIVDNLQANFTFGVDYRQSRQEEYDRNSLLIELGAIAPGTTDQATFIRSIRDNRVITGDINLTHKYNKVKDFSFISTVGARFFRTNDDQQLLTGDGGVDGTRSIETFPTQSFEDFVLQNANYGLYFLENLGYRDVLFLELGGTIDKNTSAGDETGALFLPKVGIVYNLSDEGFWKDSEFHSILTGVKLRANYGEATNFAQPFSQDRTFELESFLGGPAFRFAQPGNQDLVSETVKTTEFGVDLGFFDYRFNVGITRYNAITEDALFTPTQPPSSGLLNQVSNIGEIQNSGWELALDATVVKSGDHTLSLNASFNTNDNEVTDQGGASPFVVGGFTVIGAWVEEGQSLGYLRGTAATQNDDGTYTFTPNTALGNTFAPRFGSFGFNYSWKDLSIFTTADYQYGGKIVDLSFLLRHLRGVDNTGIPEDLVGTTSPFNYVNFFTFDNDFVKVRNIGASYKINTPFKFMKRVQIGVNITNPFNWTASGLDPETTGSGIGNQNGFSSGGFFYGTESAPRRYIGTIKFLF